MRGGSGEAAVTVVMGGEEGADFEEGRGLLEAPAARLEASSLADGRESSTLVVTVAGEEPAAVIGPGCVPRPASASELSDVALPLRSISHYHLFPNSLERVLRQTTARHSNKAELRPRWRDARRVEIGRDRRERSERGRHW